MRRVFLICLLVMAGCGKDPSAWIRHDWKGKMLVHGAWEIGLNLGDPERDADAYGKLTMQDLVLNADGTPKDPYTGRAAAFYMTEQGGFIRCDVDGFTPFGYIVYRKSDYKFLGISIGSGFSWDVVEFNMVGSSGGKSLNPPKDVPTK
jgi:hypothetical protein